MTILYAENFDYYGGNNNLMLQGFYLTLGSDFGIGYSDSAPQLPSFSPDKYWMNVAGRGAGWSRVLPAGTVTSIGVATRIYMRFMPTDITKTTDIIELRSNTQVLLVRLHVTPAGNLQVINSAGAVVTETTVPCILNNTAHKIQAQFVMHATLGEAEVRVDNVPVIGGTSGVNGENLVLPGTIGIVGQKITDSSSAGAGGFYTDFFVPYSLTGTYNDDWPSISGVQTLWPSADTTEDDWTARPLQLYGAGNLFISSDGTGDALDCAAVTGDNLGSADYTIEGWYRFNGVPTTTLLATLFAKWNATGSARSYRLVKYGPDINNGHLRLEITTDGTLGTLVTVLDVVFEFAVGHWYHIAVCRDSGVTRLFINGVQIGTDNPDANTYFAAGTSAKFAIGGEMSGTTTTVLANTSFKGSVDEIRTTPGVARYTSNFPVPSGKFPRDIGGDPDFASVQILAGFDENVVNESGVSRTLTVRGNTARQEWDDAGSGKDFRMVNYQPPIDYRFLEAAFIKASGYFTMLDLPVVDETVTLGATTYTFKSSVGTTANEVLIGADVSETLDNLIAAITQGAGAGTVYGSDTVINASATAEPGPNTGAQFTAIAHVAGTPGNSIASTTTAADSSWSGATLAGGQDIPDPEEFTFDPLPPEATGLRALFLIDRAFVDTDNATMQKSFVVDGAAADGADNALSVTPTYRGDVIEEDPDTTAALTPNSVLNGRLRLTRTS